MPLLGLASAARAQDAHRYVGLGFATAPWAVHTTAGTPRFVNSSTESRARGLTMEAGMFLKPGLGLGIEFGLPNRNELTQAWQAFGVDERVISRYRDATLFGVLTARLAGNRRIVLEATGGGGLVFHSSRERVANRTLGGTTYGPFGDERTVSRTGTGLTGGAELVVHLSSHVSLTPQYRMFLIRRGDVSTNPFNNGISAVSNRLGFGVRVSF